MERQENKYKYSQLETFKEVLELSHLRRKTLIVNILLVVLALLLVYFLFRPEIDKQDIYVPLLMFGVLILMNSLFASLPYDQYNNLKLSMYFTIIAIYIIASTLIFSFATPSIFTVLFLAYAVTSIYQDFKTMIMSSLFLFFSGGFLVSRFPKMFALVENETPQTFIILLFVLVFVLLLTLSSYILIKRKTFFYNQLASIKESEIRNIDLMNEVAELKTGKKPDYSSYHRSLKAFSKVLSEKIGVDDLFGRRIEILKELKKHKPIEIVDKYPEFDLTEIRELALMEFEVNNKITKLAQKASKSKNLDIQKKEIFSESQFKSFNHFGDSEYTKIISFAVFYTLLKIDKPYLKEIQEELLKDMLFNSEYFYRVDPKVIEVYLQNNEVFDTIVKDYLKGGW